MDTYTNKDVDLSNEATRNQFIANYNNLTKSTLPVSTITGAQGKVIPQPTTTGSTDLSSLGYISVEQANSDITNYQKEEEQKNTQVKETPRESAISKYLGLITSSAGKATETDDLQKKQDIEGKTKALNDINNKILSVSRGYEKQLREANKNITGAFGGGNVQNIKNIERQRDEQIADLSIQKAVALGDLETANKIVDMAIKTKYEPIESQIANYEKLISIYGDDMSESEKFEAQNKLNAAKEDLDYNRTRLSDAVKEAYSNGQYSLASELNSLDPQSSDFSVKLNSAISKLQEKKTGTDLLGSLPVSIQNRVISSADEFNSRKEVQKFVATVDAVNTLQYISPYSKNPADHQAIIYGFAKALDPESVVRKEEYEAVKKYSQSLFNKYKGEISNAISGTGFLSAQAIKDIQTTVDNLYQARLPQYQNAYNEKSRVIDNIAGMNVADKFLEKKDTSYTPKKEINSTTPLKTGYSGTTSSGLKFTIE